MLSLVSVSDPVRRIALFVNLAWETCCLCKDVANIARELGHSEAEIAVRSFADYSVCLACSWLKHPCILPRLLRMEHADGLHPSPKEA